MRQSNHAISYYVEVNKRNDAQRVLEIIGPGFYISCIFEKKRGAGLMVGIMTNEDLRAKLHGLEVKRLAVIESEPSGDIGFIIKGYKLWYSGAMWQEDLWHHFDS